MLSSTTSTPSVSCSPRWIVYPNMDAGGAWQDEEVTTLQRCLGACGANSSCVAVDWSDNWHCYIHNKKLPRRRNDSFTQFEIVRQCYTQPSA